MSVSHLWSAFFQGFLLMGGLIVAIGAQNAFVLTQGLKQHYVLLVVVFCALADAGLSALGVAGMGVLITKNSSLFVYIKIGGAIFLFSYGLFALRRAFQTSRLTPLEEPAGSAKKVMLTLFAFTFLNPHVYLDTVLLVGTFSSAYIPPLNWIFWLGGSFASLCWFSLLGFGAKLLIPYFQSAYAWKVLDFLIALIMFLLSIKLFIS